jgi:hypothetical protein
MVRYCPLPETLGRAWDSRDGHWDECFAKGAKAS